jgi:hypothetical protein
MSAGTAPLLPRSSRIFNYVENDDRFGAADSVLPDSIRALLCTVRPWFPTRFFGTSDVVAISTRIDREAHDSRAHPFLSRWPFDVGASPA